MVFKFFNTFILLCSSFIIVIDSLYTTIHIKFSLFITKISFLHCNLNSYNLFFQLKRVSTHVKRFPCLLLENRRVFIAESLATSNCITVWTPWHWGVVMVTMLLVVLVYCVEETCGMAKFRVEKFQKNQKVK